MSDMSDKSALARIPSLDDASLADWVESVRVHLRVQGAEGFLDDEWDMCVEKEEGKAPAKKAATAAKKDALAIQTLTLTAGKDMGRFLRQTPAADRQRAKQVFALICEKAKKRIENSAYYVEQQLRDVKLPESVDVLKKKLAEMEKMREQLDGTGYERTPVQFAQDVIHALPPSFLSFVERQAQEDDKSYEALKDRLLAELGKREAYPKKDKSGDSAFVTEDSAFFTKGQGAGGQGWQGGAGGPGWQGRGRGSWRGGRGAGGQARGPFTGTCHNCGGCGHKAFQCASPANLQRQQQQPVNGVASATNGANTAPHSYLTSEPHTDKSSAVEENVLLLDHEWAMKAWGEDQASGASIWIVDTACSRHLTGNRSLFATLRETAPIKFQLANNSNHITAAHVGDIPVKYGEHIMTLRNVFYSADVSFNLLSGTQAVQETGASLQLSKGKKVLTTAGGVDIHIEYKNRLPTVTFEKTGERASEAACYADAKVDDYLKWHQRLGHASEETVRRMNEEYGLGITRWPKPEDRFCEACAKGKSKRQPVNRDASATRATEAGECMVFDIQSLDKPSKEGHRYVLNITDEATGMTATYLQRLKSETVDNVRDYVKYVKTQQGRDVKRMRSDGGGENDNREMRELCREYGIQQAMSAPYTPEQAGMAETTHNTVGRIARTLLIASGLDESYYAYAYLHATYVKNRRVSKARNWAVPYCIWARRKPDLTYLRAFGALAYVHVRDHKQTKAGARAHKGILVGYSEIKKAYKIEMREGPNKGQLVLTRDASFDERLNSRGGSDDVPTSQESTAQASSPSLSPQAAHDEEKRDRDRPEKEEQPPPPEQVGEEKEEEKDERPRRQWKPSSQFLESLQNALYMCASDDMEDEERDADSEEHALINTPKAVQAALREPKARAAMEAELQLHKERGTWELVPRTSDMVVLRNRWVFQVKAALTPGEEKVKARLVIRGNEQADEDVHGSVYSPVARLTSTRMTVALAAYYGWELTGSDIQGAYLYASLHDDEHVYMQAPAGANIPDGLVCKLKKALYGLRVSGKRWNATVSARMKQEKYEPNPYDKCVYIKRDDDNETQSVSTLHVDDFLTAARDAKAKDAFITTLKEEYKGKVKQMPMVHLGMEITRTEEGIKLTQTRLTEKTLGNWRMEHCSSEATPMVKSLQPRRESDKKCPVNMKEVVGQLSYIANGTRPDISYAVLQLAKYSNDASDEHWQAAKRVMRYLAGTKGQGLHYRRRRDGEPAVLQAEAYADADHAGDVHDRRSVTGYVVLMAGAPVSWRSGKQDTIATSPAESELIAANACALELLYVRQWLDSAGFPQQANTLHIDNMQALDIAQDEDSSKRTKHIDVKHKKIQELCENEQIRPRHVGTADNAADIFTKPLARDKLGWLRRRQGIA